MGASTFVDDPTRTRPPATPRDGWRAQVPSVLSTVLTALAVFCAFAAVSGAFYQRAQYVRIAVDNLLLPAPANLGYAAVVGVLAASVARHKRVAYWLLVTYFGLQALADLGIIAVYYWVRAVPGDFWGGDVPYLPPLASLLTVGNLVITAGVLAALVGARGQFYAKVQRASLPKAVLTLFILLGVFAFVGWGLVEAFPGSLRGSPDRFSYAAEKVTGGAFTFDITRHGRAPGWVNLVLGLFGAIALFAALFVLTRSGTSRPVATSR